MYDYTVFSRVNRDSGTLHLPSDARFTPVFPGKMSVQKNPPASDQAETYLDIEREARYWFSKEACTSLRLTLRVYARFV